MNELSLFSGAGGGLLGTSLLGFRPVGYVEFNDYCQRVLKQRILDGYLPEAPIFGDIRTFISEGYAKEYKGMVDIITAGFPCQPFSVAGKRQGEQDERNMWPATLRVIQTVKPGLCLLENVPGLLASSHGYFGVILQGLSESGYNARWCCLSAGRLGACHKRERLWIYAYPNSEQCGNSQKRYNTIRLSKCMDAQRVQLRKCESKILGNNDVLANRVERLKTIGNGQVPAVVKAVWNLLNA